MQTIAKVMENADLEFGVDVPVDLRRKCCISADAMSSLT